MRRVILLIRGLLEQVKCTNIEVRYIVETDSLKVSYDLPENLSVEESVIKKIALENTIAKIIEDNIDIVIEEREEMENLVQEALEEIEMRRKERNVRRKVDEFWDNIMNM